jgi:hypothetical protein
MTRVGSLELRVLHDRLNRFRLCPASLASNSAGAPGLAICATAGGGCGRSPLAILAATAVICGRQIGTEKPSPRRNKENFAREATIFSTPRATLSRTDRHTADCYPRVVAAKWLDLGSRS